MGDRVLFQVIDSQGRVSPVVYGHWCGSEAKKIVAATIKQMDGRVNDVDYTTARLVQNILGGDKGNTGCGVFNQEKKLTADDSHGDAGCVIVNCDTWNVEYFGGYLKPDAQP